MGCLGSKEKEEPPPQPIQDKEPKKVDPRLPFDNYRQVFTLKNSWKAITRNLEGTAKESLLKFFRDHPEHKALHKKLIKYEDEDALRESTAFENAALAIFNTFDEAMDSIEKDKVDFAIATLQMAGKSHSDIEGFQPAYFKDMEESFLYAVKLTLGDRFTEPTEQNFRRLYEFCTQKMIEGMSGSSAPNRI